MMERSDNEIIIQKFIDDLKTDGEFFFKSEKIEEIIKLLKPDTRDPEKNQKINAGLLVLEIIEKDFKRDRDEIFFINLINQIELCNEEQLEDFFEKLPEDLKNQETIKLLEFILEKFHLESQNLKEILDSFSLKESESIDSSASLTEFKIEHQVLIEIYSKLFLAKDQELKNQIIDSIDDEDKNELLKKMIFISVLNNHHEIFNLLIDKISHEEQFILVNHYQDNNGRTIFEIACDCKRLMIIKKLCENFDGEKILEILEEKKGHNHNQFSFVCGNCNQEIINLLLKKLDDHQIYKLLTDDFLFDNVSSINILIAMNYVDVVKFCFEKINDEEKIYKLLTTQYSQQNTNLHSVFLHNRDIELARVMLEKIIDPKKIEELLAIKSESLANILHLCQLYQPSDIEEVLLARLEPEQIINLLTSIDEQGFSVIHYSVSGVFIEMFKTLLKKLNDEQTFILFYEIKKSLLHTDLQQLNPTMDSTPRRIMNPNKKMPFKFCLAENLEKFKKILDAKNLKLDKNLEVVFNTKRSAEQDELPSSSVRNSKAKRSVLSLMR